MGEDAGLRGLVVVGGDDQDAVRAELFRFLRVMDRLGRIVGAGAGNDLGAALDDLNVADSPVVPTGMTPSIPASTCSSRSWANAFSSTLSLRKGVMRAVKVPR